MRITPSLVVRLSVVASAVLGLPAFHISSLSIQQPVVISNPAPDPDTPAFRLAAEPLLKVGGLNDDERYEILGFTAVDLSSKGNLLIAPTGGVGANRTLIRVFAPPGRFVRTIGRRGQGPGEFQQITSMTTGAADSIFVHDRVSQRRTVFDSTGVLARTQPRSGGDRCCFANGAYLVVPGPDERAVDPGTPPPWDTVAVVVGRPGEGPAGERQIMVLPGYERFVCLNRSPDGRCTSALARPFVPQPIVRIAGDEIVYANAARYEFQVYSQSGVLLRTVRAAVTPTPVTKTDIDSARTSLLSRGSPESKRQMEAGLSRIMFPSTQPVYRSLLTQEDGTVWVAACARQTPDRCWARFDRSGKLQGALRIPARLTVQRFVMNHVIVSEFDTADQSVTVSVYRIEST
jgi:hypothetical protein